MIRLLAVLLLATPLIGFGQITTTSTLRYKVIGDEIFQYDAAYPKNQTKSNISIEEALEWNKQFEPTLSLPVNAALTPSNTGQNINVRPLQNINSNLGQNINPYYRYTGQPKNIAEKNTALPKITFRDPLYKSEATYGSGVAPVNPIGGLPTYPGRLPK